MNERESRKDIKFPIILEVNQALHQATNKNLTSSKCCTTGLKTHWNFFFFFTYKFGSIWLTKIMDHTFQTLCTNQNFPHYNWGSTWKTFYHLIGNWINWREYNILLMKDFVFWLEEKIYNSLKSYKQPENVPTFVKEHAHVNRSSKNLFSFFFCYKFRNVKCFNTTFK